MKMPSRSAATNTADTIDTFESVLVLRWKICDTRDPSYAYRCLRRTLDRAVPLYDAPKLSLRLFAHKT